MGEARAGAVGDLCVLGLGLVAWGRANSTLWPPGLATRLPSTKVELTIATGVERTMSPATVGDVSVSMGRRLTVGTRWNLTGMLGG